MMGRVCGSVERSRHSRQVVVIRTWKRELRVCWARVSDPLSVIRLLDVTQTGAEGSGRGHGRAVDVTEGSGSGHEQGGEHIEQQHKREVRDARPWDAGTAKQRCRQLSGGAAGSGQEGQSQQSGRARQGKQPCHDITRHGCSD